MSRTGGIRGGVQGIVMGQGESTCWLGVVIVGVPFQGRESAKTGNRS